MMIWKNFFRDLVQVTSRLISVIIITTVAVMVYVGLNGIQYNGNRIVEEYFQDQNVADLWVTGNLLNEDDFEEIKRIKGIEALEQRLNFEVSQAGNKEIKMALYGISTEAKVNQSVLIEGTLPENPDEMLLSYEFAMEQGLSIGEDYSVTVPGLKEDLSFKIVGLIKNPERMYNISATMPSPDFSKYGFAYVSEEALFDVFGEGQYNQIVVKLENQADSEEVKNEIIQTLDEKIMDVISLDENIRTYNLLNFIEGIKPIIKGFPLIFFVIAALLMVSTMSRLVENSRSSIGTFKALGYTDVKILLYYFLYSVIVVALGFTLGSLLANQVITKPISGVLFALNDLPTYTLEYDPKALITALILTGVSCMGTSLMITRNALKENPAQCMRPKPPKKETRIFVERIPAIWNRLGFNKKYILKNTFRNKGRVFTCIFGIAACMALILTCLSLKDAISNFTEQVKSNEHKYDLFVTMNPKHPAYKLERIMDLDQVEDTQFVMNSTATLMVNEGYETISVQATEDVVDLKLMETYSKSPSFLHLDGAILEEDLAESYELEVGDILQIKFPGEVEFTEVKIAELNKSVKGVYLGRTYINEIGQEFLPNTVYIKSEELKALIEDIEKLDFVNGYERKDNITDAITSQISILSLVVYILIALGGILAVVVLYNLGIMSFYEQIRSLATLMVLGFYPKEIKRLQLTENIIFALLGIGVGVPLGMGLTKLITNALTLADLQIATRGISYVLAAVLTLFFAYLVNVLIGRMMKGIDMLGALKSVE